MDNKMTIEYNRLKALQMAETSQLLPRQGHVNYWCEMDNAMLIIEELMRENDLLKKENRTLKNYLCTQEDLKDVLSNKDPETIIQQVTEAIKKVPPQPDKHTFVNIDDIIPSKA